jgi:small subunit ribosomal protein S1
MGIEWGKNKKIFLDILAILWDIATIILMKNIKNAAPKEPSAISILIKNDPGLKFFKEGDVAKGTIIKQDGTNVYVDLGTAGVGIIYGKEFYDASTYLRNLNPGDEITAMVVMAENNDGYIELSLNEIGQNMLWDDLKEKMEKKAIVKVKIAEINKGGLIANISGVPAFLPVSQLSMENYPRVEGGDKSKIFQELERHLGKEFDVRVIDVDRVEKKIILSEKEAQQEKTLEILRSCKEGDVVEGIISGIADFGVFVKFMVPTDRGEQEYEGLIHISELSWELISNPHDFIKVGEKVKAKIISTNNGRVSLSLKALGDDPWKVAADVYKKGQVVEGMVFKFNPFGAFVKLPSGIHGLCHVSDFESPAVMKEKLKIGSTYTFTISSFSAQAHKLGLSFGDGGVKKEEAAAPAEEVKKEKKPRKTKKAAAEKETEEAAEEKAEE